ncbi:hypothetical protein B0I63_002597 [Clostridium beijerinckii]|nr:hypothetical protein [Clostridium beijerinckii]NRU22563.1 hypothetical protein [Clostridium beijerinckii]
MNGEWVGTVDEKATTYTIPSGKIKVSKNSPAVVSIEAFDYDGETSKIRSKVNL